MRTAPYEVRCVTNRSMSSTWNHKEDLLTNQHHPGFSVRYFQQDEDFQKDGRPVVALIVALWTPKLSNWSAQAIHDLTMQAVKTVREQGGRPLVIDSSAPTLQARGTAWHDGVDDAAARLRRSGGEQGA